MTVASKPRKSNKSVLIRVFNFSKHLEFHTVQTDPMFLSHLSTILLLFTHKIHSWKTKKQNKSLNQLLFYYWKSHFQMGKSTINGYFPKLFWHNQRLVGRINTPQLSESVSSPPRSNLALAKTEDTHILVTLVTQKRNSEIQHICRDYTGIMC